MFVNHYFPHEIQAQPRPLLSLSRTEKGIKYITSRLQELDRGYRFDRTKNYYPPQMAIHSANITKNTFYPNWL